MRNRVVALVGPTLELYPVTCASAVFGWHGPDIPHRYDFRMCTERPGPVRTTLGVDVVVENGLEALADADTILIAGWCPGPDVPPALGDAVRAAHARGARIVATCSGVYVPASLGLLDGRRAAIHWECAGALARQYPRISTDATVLYVDHGDVATAGATATTIDLCLNQVRRDHGAALAMRIGRQLSAPPLREGEQRQYPALPTTGPVPDPIAPLLDWIAANLHRPLSLEDMATRSGVSPRTLSRYFADQLGTSPGRWLLDRRIASTRALLEETDLPVETIAKRVGLSSAVNLRRHFRHTLRTTPGAYRRAFRSTPA
ncbi:AraC family transcriptional regulator [Virgisporangium aliadipatigenens]|uniref:AraC family transcriptional regulator n=1 Tax=Virgisporangium aliadipatigenens TaxID=741659 RepID=A0A8J4DMP5_9ACTN|nr:helix-turn-helix domain-containing protein [Virgisporangium aliadipatigenens]GIJ43599.1 AraC family transcriptional regulator [Virgisporangium aliadipatigenens]